MVGSTLLRTMEYTASGSVVDPTPETKKVVTKSSNDSVNASSAPASTPGISSGSVTRRKVDNSSAPRLIAASSSARSVPCSRASTTTVTNGMLNAVWATTMVAMPSAIPSQEKSTSKDTPATISGVTMGR